jgi:hypothetical protein
MMKKIRIAAAVGGIVAYIILFFSVLKVPRIDAECISTVAVPCPVSQK